MLAVLYYNVDAVTILLKMGVDPNAIDTLRRTALILAVTNTDRDKEIMTCLLEHRALDLAIKDCRGRTYAYWVARLGLRRSDIESRVSKSVENRINCLTFSNLALHGASASSREDVFLDAMSYTQDKKLAEQDNNGRTALYTATRYHAEKIKVRLNAVLNTRLSTPILKKSRGWHRKDKSLQLRVSDSTS